MSRYLVKLAEGTTEIEPTIPDEGLVVKEGVVRLIVPKEYIGKKVIVVVWVEGYIRKEIEDKRKIKSVKPTA